MCLGFAEAARSSFKVSQWRLGRPGKNQDSTRPLIDHISEDRRIKIGLTAEPPLLSFGASNAAILESRALWLSGSFLSFQPESAMRGRFVRQSMTSRG